MKVELSAGGNRPSRCGLRNHEGRARWIVDARAWPFARPQGRLVEAEYEHPTTATWSRWKKSERLGQP